MSFCLDDVALIAKYTLPSDKQTSFNHSKITWNNLDVALKSHPNIDLLGSCLRLYQEELSLRKSFPTDYDRLLHLLNSISTSGSFASIYEVALEVIGSSNMPTCCTISGLLKSFNLPSRVPALEKIFKMRNILLKALDNFFKQEVPSLPDSLDEFSPLWSQLVLPALFPGAQLKNPLKLPSDVLAQAQLYLDISKPLLLFSFPHEEYRPDQRVLFGELAKIQKWAKKLATRTLASSMLLLGSLDTLPANIQLPAPICLEVKDSAKTANFQLYEQISSEFTANVDFASGVRRALSLYGVKGRIEPLWIFKHFSPNGEFTSEQAGLLSGLGLIGGLKSFTSTDAYELLSAGNEEIISAVLFGMSASNNGTGHEKKFIAQMIGLHVPGYLPVIEGNNPQISQIPLSNQIAACLALGLLFNDTSDQRVSNILYREMGRRGLVSTKSKVAYSPAYATACGYSLGLVNQGSRDALNDVQVDLLLGMFNGNDDSDVPAAFFALLGMFAGSQDSIVSGQILTGHDHNHPSRSKPFHLMLQYLLKALISRVFPADINALLHSLKYNLDHFPATWDLDTNIATKVHIIAAYSLFLAIHFAGSANVEATRQLNAILTSVTKRSFEMDSFMTFSQKYSQKNLSFLKDILLVSMALINAGTGSKKVFLTLRSSFLSLLDECPTRAYHHHLALGFLLLGNGKLTLSTSSGCDQAAVAAILASTFAGMNFPFMEDTYFWPSHMQYLWISAVRPRVPCDQEQTEGDSADPEDLFLSGSDGSRPKYYCRMTGKSEAYSNISVAERDFLHTLYSKLIERGHEGLSFDLLSLG